jgi:ParB family chromosome partitioning protein
MNTVPAIVREATEQQMAEIALVENIFREDLNPIERASAYKRYCDEFGLSADQVAARLGEDRTTVTNYMRLLELPEQVKNWVSESRLSMGHARCLLGLRSSGDIQQTAKHAIDSDLSVRALEKLVRERLATGDEQSKNTAPPVSAKRPQVRNLEEAFVRSLSTKVEISESRKKGSGRIVIHYFSLDDFDRIAQRLGIPTD